MTDIATGWTVDRSVKNKAAIWVFEAIEYVVAQFPFPILGIDSDNGSEFIDAHLLAWCVAHKITFTRSRPGNKNDRSHVEQKNWTHVRELVGYLRFDTEAELCLLNEIWELDRVYTNYLLAQQKLVAKVRHGAKASNRHERPSGHPLRARQRPPSALERLAARHGGDHGHHRTRRPLPHDPRADRANRKAGPEQGPCTGQATGEQGLQQEPSSGGFP